VSYPATVQQSMRAAAAWRFACMVLTVGVVVLGAVVMHSASVQRTVIVPYGRYAGNTAVKVEGHPEADAPYLRLLAMADLATLLDWQPGTIEHSLNLFLTRLSGEAYARYNLDLRNQAQKFSQLNVSEVFWPEKIEFQPPDAIKVTGRLARYTGDNSPQNTLNTSATYVIHYSETPDGVYVISALETPQ
jgi:hypothetical protein